MLLVDDEPDVIETVAFRLEQEGYEVLTATDGLEALDATRSNLPDLLILDVMLPGENGYRVAHKLREEQQAGTYPRPLPIILLTARDLSSDPEREKIFMDFSGADRVIYKPFDLDDLVAQVGELLEDRP
ncbi:MAG: response regulator [Acidobacteria bacterium]|nr:response regulator [Acidobacteriota bacterium]